MHIKTISQGTDYTDGAVSDEEKRVVVEAVRRNHEEWRTMSSPGRLSVVVALVTMLVVEGEATLEEIFEFSLHSLAKQDIEETRR